MWSMWATVFSSWVEQRRSQLEHKMTVWEDYPCTLWRGQYWGLEIHFSEGNLWWEHAAPPFGGNQLFEARHDVRSPLLAAAVVRGYSNRAGDLVDAIKISHLTVDSFKEVNCEELLCRGSFHNEMSWCHWSRFIRTKIRFGFIFSSDCNFTTNHPGEITS